MKGLGTETHKLNKYSDEELVMMAQGGNDEAMERIISKYKGLVYAKAKPYFLAGADEEDIIQEGLIGLYKAVKSFDGLRFPYFKVFAGVCVSRHIITAVKAAARKKHIPLNSYVSLDKNVYDENERPLMDIVDITSVERHQNPETILIDRENIDGMEYKINKALSKLELQVLVYYLEGQSYQKIADLLNKDVKSVDNAIQRIKKKVETILNTRNV